MLPIACSRPSLCPFLVQVRLHILLQLDGLAEWMPAMAEQVGWLTRTVTLGVQDRGAPQNLSRLFVVTQCLESRTIATFLQVPINDHLSHA